MGKLIIAAVFAVLVIAALISLYPIVGYIAAALAVASIVAFVLIKKKNKDKQNQVLAEREQLIKKNEINRQKFLSDEAEKFNSEISQIKEVCVTTEERERHLRTLEEMPQIKFIKITRKTNIENLFPLVIIDVETTGLNCRSHDIIEVSAIKYESGFKPDYKFSTLCKVESPLPEEIVKITNITDDMLADAPTFEAVISSLSDFISGCNIAGYNLEFDLKFLFVHGLDLPSKVKYIDVMELAKSKLKRAPYNDNSTNYSYDVLDYKLQTVAEHFNIYRNNAHRSLSDCYATGKVFEELIDEFIA